MDNPGLRIFLQIHPRRTHQTKGTTMKRIRTAIVFVSLLVLGAPALRAQVEKTAPLQAPNTIYGELGGKGLVYGFYYERLFTPRLGASIGFSSWSFSFFSSIDVTIIPFFLSWYPVGEENHLYVDAGADYVHLTAEIGPFGSAVGSNTVPFIGTGYCYRSNTGGLYFKIGPMLLFGGGQVQAWANLSAGFTF